jgi:hypothetical protein
MFLQLIIAIVVSGATLLYAYADTVEVVSKHNNPRLGVIASASVGAASTKAIQSEVAGDELFAKNAQPIQASLSGIKDGFWTITIKNTTNDRFSLYLRLTQVRSSGEGVSTASIAAELRPLATVVRRVSRVSGSSGAELSLVRYRNRTEEKEGRLK